jgi:hypothetical protein
VTRNIPTNGKIAGGGIVERELGFQLATMDRTRIALRNPDLTTARRIAQAINNFLRVPSARPLDPGTVLLLVPENRRGDLVNLLTDIEQLPVEPDQIARVVIDEKTGTVVMGDAVRISTVAIAHGNLTIRITEAPQVSQPNPFAPQGAGGPTIPGQITGGAIAPGGATVVVPRTPRDPSLRRHAAGTGQRAQRAGLRSARHDHDPAGDQGRWRPPGRCRGAVMSAMTGASALVGTAQNALMAGTTPPRLPGGSAPRTEDAMRVGRQF